MIQVILLFFKTSSVIRNAILITLVVGAVGMFARNYVNNIVENALTIQRAEITLEQIEIKNQIEAAVDVFNADIATLEAEITKDIKVAVDEVSNKVEEVSIKTHTMEDKPAAQLLKETIRILQQ